jgi:hypothetical protein
MPKTNNQRPFDDVLRWATSPLLDTARQITDMMNSVRLMADTMNTVAKAQDLINAFRPILRTMEDAGSLAQMADQWKQLSEVVAQQAFLPLHEAERETLQAAAEEALRAMSAYSTSPRFQQTSEQLLQTLDQSSTFAGVVHQVADVAEAVGQTNETGGERPDQESTAPVAAPRSAPPISQGIHTRTRKSTARAKPSSRQRRAAAALASRPAELSKEQYEADIGRIVAAVLDHLDKTADDSAEKQATTAAPSSSKAAPQPWTRDQRLAAAMLIINFLMFLAGVYGALHGAAPVIVYPPTPVVPSPSSTATP